MACERFRDALSELAAGEPAAPALVAHLPECEPCRAELEALRRALAVADAELASLPLATPSPGLGARIRTAASEAPAAPARRPRFWLALAGAAAALLVAVGMLAHRQPQSRTATVAKEAQRAADALEKPTPADERRTFAVDAAAPVHAAASSPRPSASRLPAVEPEVLVPAGEAEALLRFAADVRQRRVTPTSLLVADLNTPLAESGDVHIRPIEIVPLGPEEDSGSE